MTDDPYRLERFEQAQQHDATYDRALAELRAGRKASHWMWFVFPQLGGLGRSTTAAHYAVGSLDEARSYLTHPVLGPRLLECATVVTALPAGAEAILGGIDAKKLRSSMTLFLRAAPHEPVFQQVLDRHFGGVPDPATDELLRRA